MTQRFNLIKLTLLVVLGIFSQHSISQIACNADLQISIDPVGIATFTVDMAEAGNATTYESKWVVPNQFTCAEIGTPQDYTLYGQYANGDIDSCMGTVTIYDFLAPVAIVDSDVLVSLNEDGTLMLSPEMIDEGSYDNCSSFSLEITPNMITCESTNPIVAILTVTDLGGNSSQAWTNVFWNEIPYSADVQCNEFNTLNVINGPVTVSLSDVLLSGSSACPSDYSFVIEYEGVQEQDLVFDDSDIGKEFDVIVLNWTTGLVCDFSFTVVSGNSPYELCAQDYSGKGIVDVEMTVGNLTDDTGCITIDEASGLIITPSKVGNPTEGVDMIDYAIMRSRILGASMMNADQMIAADLYDSPGNVTTLDLVMLEKMLLGEFIPEKVWIFRDASEVFPDNEVPSNYSQSIELGNQNSYSFVGIKLGDVDLSFDEIISEDDMASLLIKDVVLNKGENYSVPMRLENDQQLVATNMYVKSESDTYVITNVTSTLPGYTFDPSEDINDGVLNLVWIAEDEVIATGGYNYVGNDALFTLEISAKENSVLNETFEISFDSYSKVLASGSNKGIALDLEIQELITVPVFNTKSYEVLEISPNPSSSLIHVVTNFPTNSKSTFSIYNSIGQLVDGGVFTSSSIDISDLSPGLYSFILRNENSYSRSMIVKE